MKTQIVNGVEVHSGSNNVFADLDLADAEKLKVKTGLVLQIRSTMKQQRLTQQEAAQKMGITHARKKSPHQRLVILVSASRAFRLGVARSSLTNRH
jgi:ABC-type thiamine transport system ATPase subunit